MKFGAVAPKDAEGAILAHSMMVAGNRLRKGSLLTQKDIAAMGLAGVEYVTVARLEGGDLGRSCRSD